MKSFVYTYKEKVKSDGVEKTVNVYRIYKNRIVPVGSITSMLRDSFQLVMKVLERDSALPPVCFAMDTNGCQIYNSQQKLEKDGFAVIERVE